MSLFISSIDRAKKQFEDAEGTIRDEELAFQMLDKLPDSYDFLVSQLYQLNEEKFITETIRRKLLAE